MHLTPGTIVAGRFRLESLIARGGMGSVWRAVHLELGQPCAVKFILPDLVNSADVRGRFEQEAAIAKALRSRHIAKILDYGTWQGAPYMAMEYLEGEDLQARLSRVERMEPAETVDLVTQVARALTKAHGRGLVHRDLKPENIFLSREGDREIARVLDFGVAKAISDASSLVQTQKGILIGTFAFMSPEQLRGTEDIDQRCDVWALAVVAFHCLTGRLPFDGESLNCLVLQVLIDERPRPTALAPSLPSAVDTWWERATSANVDERFQTARDLAAALACALASVSDERPTTRTLGAREKHALAMAAPVRADKTIADPISESTTPVSLDGEAAPDPFDEGATTVRFAPVGEEPVADRASATGPLASRQRASRPRGGDHARASIAALAVACLGALWVVRAASPRTAVASSTRVESVAVAVPTPAEPPSAAAPLEPAPAARGADPGSNAPEPERPSGAPVLDADEWVDEAPKTGSATGSPRVVVSPARSRGSVVPPSRSRWFRKKGADPLATRH